MAFIAELTIQSKLMRDTTRKIPNAEFEMEDLQLLESGKAKALYWVNNVSIEELEEALEDDNMVDEYKLLTETPQKSLYRITFTEEGKEILTYPVASASDIVILDVKKSDDEAHIRARIPTREALSSYRKACKERGIEFHLGKIYEEGDVEGEPYGLTESQSEALKLCYSMGYFDDDRANSLSDIADELDISRQALAARLKRGHSNLIESTLVQG